MKKLSTGKLTLRRETIRTLVGLEEVAGGAPFSTEPFGCNYTRQNSCDTVTFGSCGRSLGIACDISYTPTVCG